MVGLGMGLCPQDVELGTHLALKRKLGGGGEKRKVGPGEQGSIIKTPVPLRLHGGGVTSAPCQALAAR